MTLTKTFKEISMKDVAQAGGKGASLGEMTQAGIPVPPGYVILSDAFEKFIDATSIRSDIDGILHEVNHEEMASVEHASEKIQQLIVGQEMPSELNDEIMKEFEALKCEFVAVRSSATAEDSSSAAWAGQLDTYLNTTEEDLLKNVRRCWASLFTPRAIFYRFEKGLHDHFISVAVIVQKMVQSDVAGIAFSVHPVTEHREHMIIEAGYGLGEAIVSGQITPDSYVVEKGSWDLIEKHIGEQRRKLIRTANGNEWKDIPEGGKQKLTEEQILEIAKMIVRIEDHYKHPVDVEWAIDNDLYIVQSRPITTLKETSA